MRAIGNAFSTCIHGIKIHIIHYTPIHGERLLHGHTLVLSLCVEGELRNYWVIDFEELKDIAMSIARNYDHAVLVRAEDKDKVRLEGPFNVKLRYVDGEATAELIAGLICSEVWEALKRVRVRISRVKVRIYEDSDVSATATCGTGSASRQVC